MKRRKKPKGFLIAKNEKYAYAGVHLIVEFWQAENLNSRKIIKKALEDAVVASGSKLLSLRLHQFEPSGFSGVAIVSESHISVHTWPKIGYAALDIFSFFYTQPYKALDTLIDYFKPGGVSITEVKRGVGPMEKWSKSIENSL